ncbi:DUF2947 family protein [Niabella hibiscisoli]|uniref:DUF2947 family protein n=1 Tax=Niabella hibiscisoli TaxID=1825928 RepID=UPI001F0E6C6D|nr:DUF2947 family protein [Niabella hibiscisoli]MCH5719602.1 DUF2947 domain-containing protein [Niabella hibiscisoli]
MNINFRNIGQYIIPISEFSLSWRFTDEKYNGLPDQDLEQLKPLNKNGARFIWHHYVTKANLHKDFPFKKDFFSIVDQKAFTDDKEKDMQKWLYEKGVPRNQMVFLSWEPELAIMVPWSLFIRYIGCFYYPGSDDLTVMDTDLTWALLCHHEDIMYFGIRSTLKQNE